MEAPTTAAETTADPQGEEVLARLRLAGTVGLSPRLVGRLLERFGSAGAVLLAPPAALVSVPGMGAARAALLAGAPSPDDARREMERLHAAGADLLHPGVPGWPEALDDLADPPPVLYVRGELAGTLSSSAPPESVRAALRGRGVAIVGSRRASAYGLAQARAIAAVLAAVGVPVISGLARGIDGAAHRGALDAGGTTIGVLGGGLARFYPPEHVPLAREIADGRGAVLSEFPLDAPPLPHHFPRRNRLLAALSAAVVVVEAAEGSGSLLTADHALDLGREVLAVPGRVDAPNSRGVHKLLREGAALCEGAADVLRALGVEADPGTPVSGTDGGRRAVAGATPAESSLLAALESEEIDADGLLERTGLPAPEGLAALSALELRGAVRLGGDGRYARIP